MREVNPVDLVQQQFVVARICQKYGFWTWREKENEQNIKMCLCLLMQRSLRQSTCTRFFLTTFCFWRKLRNRRERFVYSLIAALIKSPLATVRAALCNGLVRLFGRSHLEQSASSFKTVFLLGSDICAETENFLRQRDDVAHLRIIYFVLYKCTHYYSYYY